MNKFKGIMVFLLILAMSAGIATSEQVVTKQMTSIGIPVPEQGVTFTKLEISPPYINFMLQPGETKETTVTLKNKDKIVVSVKPNTVLASSGGFNLNPAWIKVTPESAEIPAGGSQEFTIKVTLPVDASTGKSELKIAFTDETIPSSYPSPFPNYIHALQVSLEIQAVPKLQAMPKEILNKGHHIAVKGWQKPENINANNFPEVPGAKISKEVTLQETGGIITGIVTSLNGTPVVNASVYAQGPGYVTNATDIHGNYMLGGLTEGNYIISVSPPSGSNFISNITMVHVSQNETVTANIILQTGGIITGVVTSLNGTPVADANVYSQGIGYGSSSITDINGNYMLGGLTDGNYIINVIPPSGSNFISNSTIVHVSQDKTVTSNIILQTGGIITGFITSSNGTPFPDVYVYVQGTGYGSSSITDIHGNYMLGGLTDGNYIISVSPPYGSNFISNSTMVHVSQDKTVNTNIILQTGGIITGIITTSKGIPVADAYVYTSGPGYGSAVTDINGNYMLGGLTGGNYIISVSPPYGSNFISNSTMVHVSQDETVTSNIILQTGGIITGIVTTSNGTPVVDAYVYTWGPGPSSGSAMTDVNGNYMLGGLTGGIYIISVSPPSGSNFISNSTIVHVSQDETVTSNIILQTGGIITGIVTTSNGTPVAEAYVYAQGTGYGSAMTDINGNYMLIGLQSGNYIFSVIPPYESNFISNSTVIHVSQDETVTANIILQTGGIITGIVTTSNGTPVADAYVYAQGSGCGCITTNTKGNYTIIGLQAGNYIISVSPPYGSNLVSNSTLVHVSQDETVTANIILQTGGIITGIVTTSNGTPVANAYVYTQGSGYFYLPTPYVSSITDIYGNYSLVGLQSGNYVVYAYPPYGNLSLNSTNVTVKIGETSIANIILQTIAIIPPSINSVEIRGEVADGPFLWDAYNFPAFFYDFRGDVKTETLNISYINGSIIPAGQLIYSTTPEEVSFAHSDFGKYQVIGLMTDKYFGAYTSNTSSFNPGTNFSNMSTYANGLLHKVLIDDDTKRTISVGGTIELKEGYVLKATDIDPSAKTMLLSLLKDGREVDVAPLMAGKTYVYTKTISGVKNLPLIVVRLDDVFQAPEVEVAFLKGLFQLSENATSVKVGDQFDKMNITNVTRDAITMKNDLDISLDRNTNIVLLGNIQLKVANNDSLRFYPFVEFNQPGKYEVRGSIADAGADNTIMPSWNAQSFAGFFYDINNNVSTEQLSINETLASLGKNDLIDGRELVYSTSPKELRFKMNEEQNVTVTGASTYDVVGWQAEKWVAVNGVGNKLAKLAFEMGKDDKKTLITGETWEMGSGYELTINAVDARSTPRQVWFTLKKGGAIVDEGIGQGASGTQDSKQKAVYYKTKTILGESNALLFTVYVDSIFSGATSDMVQFKYAWLIDESSAKEIKSADKFGVFEVRSATSDYIQMTNENPVNLSRNNETTLMGELKFKVADTDNLRFYPKIDYSIGETPVVPVLTYLTVSPASPLTLMGNVTNFTAAPKDQNGNAVYAIVTWSSSNTSVGTISSTGKFTAIAAGTTTITATSETISQTATVTVAGSITEIVEIYLPPGETAVNQTAGVSLALSDFEGANLSQTNFAQVLLAWLFP
ncbi:MAG: S-layer protein domain-containing protein [Candidatus Methanoperedens sp.]|nr:S-layer protein domain-containing protein [Candidatus Methanoperedens sp.]